MEKLRAWLLANRTSVRAAFLLRMFAMGAGSLLGLFFTRLLLRAMGDALYGLFLSFNAISRIGGLGDFGVSGAIALHAGKALAKPDDGSLAHYLAAARALLLVLAGSLGVGFVLLSPWLPKWLGFEPIAGAGSLSVLFAWGGLGIALTVLGGYFHALNYAHGTVTWPILPTLLVAQALAPVCHWLLARAGAPLWWQMMPYFAASAATALLACQMVRWSHPWLGRLRPLSADRGLWLALAGTSGWVYLSTLGNAIYHTTDRLVINAGFGAASVPAYQVNYKLCELAVTLVLTASYVSLPKITQWLASGDPSNQARLIEEVHRLNLFQMLLGCAAALIYLAVNDWFVRLWVGAEYHVPLLLQAGFGANLAVTTGGDAGIQLSSRCGQNGMRNMGLAVGLTGLLNLLLSILAMWTGSIAGIAWATVVAQLGLGLWLGTLTCSHFGMSLGPWIARSCLLPLAVVVTAATLRHFLAPVSITATAMLTCAYVAVLLFAARVAGMTPAMLAREITLLRTIATGR